MKRFNRSIVLQFDDSTTGNSGADLPVTVRFSDTQIKATLYSANEAIPANEIANPVTSDSRGNYTFFVEDGTYDVIINEGQSGSYTLLDEQIFDESTEATFSEQLVSVTAGQSVFPIAGIPRTVVLDGKVLSSSASEWSIDANDDLVLSEAIVDDEQVLVVWTVSDTVSAPTEVATVLLTQLGAMDNSAIDTQLFNAVNQYTRVSFEGLTNVWLDNPLTITSNCDTWLLHGCTLTLKQEGLVFESESMTIDMDGGAIYGALKYARLTADAAIGATTLTVDDSSDFTPTAVAQPMTNAWQDTNYVASSADNTNMPNAQSRAITNGGYNLVRSTTPTTITCDIPILNGAANPLRAGTHVANWYFGSTGLRFTGKNQATIKNGTLGKFRGYIASFEQSFKDTSEKLGNFTLSNIEMVKSGLDNFRFAGHTFLLDGVRMASGEQIELYKQLIVSTWNVDGAIIFRNCDIKRHDHDADVMVFDTNDGVSPTTNGSVIYDNSVMDGSWNEQWGNAGEKNGRLSTAAPASAGDVYQLHSVVPFNSDNTFNNLIAKGSKFLGISRSIFGTTYVSKDVYSYNKCSVEDSYSDGDIIYVSINGKGTREVYKDLKCTVTNSTVHARAFSLNYSVNTTYRDCEMICLPEVITGDITAVGTDYAKIIGGRMVGRFKVQGALTRIENVSLPRGGDGSYFPLIGTDYFGNTNDSVALEGLDRTEAGSINISEWIIPNAGNQPGLPGFAITNDVNSMRWIYGSQTGGGPFYRSELIAETQDDAPLPASGKFNNVLPRYSYIKNNYENTITTLHNTSTSNPIVNNVADTDTTIVVNKAFTAAAPVSVGDVIALIDIEDSIGNILPESPVTVYFRATAVTEVGVQMTITLDRQVGFPIKNDDTRWTDNDYDRVYMYHIGGEGAEGYPFTILNSVSTAFTSGYAGALNKRTIQADGAANFAVSFNDGFPVGFTCYAINIGTGGLAISMAGTDTISGNTTPGTLTTIKITKIAPTKWLAE